LLSDFPFFFGLLCFLHNFLRLWLLLLDKKRRRNTFHFGIMKRLYAANMCLPITETINGPQTGPKNQLFVCRPNKFSIWSLNQFQSEPTKLNEKLGCQWVGTTNEEWIGSCYYSWMHHIVHFNSSVSKMVETRLLLSILTSCLNKTKIEK